MIRYIPAMTDPGERLDRVFAAMQQGDRAAAAELLPIIYDELRDLARRRLAHLPPGQTLQATALVNEAYLRVVGDRDPGWESLGHLFGAFARAIRNVLVDKARTKGRRKRGGEWHRITLDPNLFSPDADDDGRRFLALDEAIDRLAALDARKAAVVNLRFFTGRSLDEIAHMLGVTTRTVERDWDFARVWLHRELREEGDAPATARA
jgi:RNA polymerase sigma factor (TIGR02999 family)